MINEPNTTTNQPVTPANPEKSNKTIFWILGCGGCAMLTLFFTIFIGGIIYFISVADEGDEYDYEDDYDDYNYNYNDNTNSDYNDDDIYYDLNILAPDLLDGYKNQGYEFTFTPTSQYQDYKYYSATGDGYNFTYGVKGEYVSSITTSVSNFMDNSKEPDIELLKTTLLVVNPAFASTGWLDKELQQANESTETTYLSDNDDEGIYYNLSVYTYDTGDGKKSKSITLLVNPSYTTDSETEDYEDDYTY